MGPSLIFDKSFLESLTLDESVWLDNFFLTNITPIFYVESLGDLEKTNKKGRVSRTSEELVEEIVRKTPILESCPNVHHQRLVSEDLLGRPVEMTIHHRPIISGGNYNVSPDGKVSIDYQQFPESVALERWKKHEFQEIEREVAHNWRQMLSNLNFDSLIAQVKNDIPNETHFSKLEDVKRYVDKVVKSKYHQFIYFALNLLNIPDKLHSRIRRRWSDTRPKPFSEFAPYAAYVLSINMFFYLCLDKSFISKDRQSNLIDLSYLYYLPFCMVFASNDNLHSRVAPLFMGSEQSFIKGCELKEALKKLNDYYLKLPDEIKKRGVMEFAVYPPEDQDTLITRLFDKHLKPSWRANAKASKAELGKLKKYDRKFMEQLKKRQREQKPYIGTPPPSDSVDSMTLTKRVPARRGSWMLLPPEVINKERNRV